jgi:hypothetical protein
MNTIQYIIRVIKRFGLFGQIDAAGLIQEIINYQTELVKNSGMREYNTDFMSRVNQSISVRKTLNATLDKWVTDLTANPEFTEVDVAESAYDPTRLPGLVIAPELPFPESTVTVEVLPPVTPEIFVSDPFIEEADKQTDADLKQITDFVPADSKPRKPRKTTKPRKPKKGK